MDKLRKEIKYFKELHSDVTLKMNHKEYYYHDSLYFLNKILNGKFYEANKIYWDEILLRAHFASITSIMRSEKWLEGILISMEAENYILFSASLRGFLEAVADSYYSLLNAPFDIVCNFNNIKLAVEGKLERELRAGALEESLIHFEYASKLNKTGMYYNNVLYTSKYIKIFDKYGNGDAKRLYSELCEVVHPAANSVSPFTKKIRRNEELEYKTTATNLDNEHIDKILHNHNTTILELLKLSINTPILCLKVLNLFEYKLIESKYLDKCIINNTINNEVWNELINLAEKS